ncbi:MAG: universal stress protein [Planctomycetaceae bacterium]|nr:universal stress protein [Planctomycetaceae bacterium]
MIQLKQILLPVDFSECSGEATKYACAFTEQFQAELHLLHVVEQIGSTIAETTAEMASAFEDYLEMADAKALAKLGQVLEPNWVEGQQVTLATRLGSPFVNIIEYTKEHQIDLIVIGTHGRSGLSHVLIGSVAERVVRMAPCPVLTVRPHGHQFIES